MTIEKKQLSDDLGKMQTGLEELFEKNAAQRQLVLASHEDSEQTISSEQYNLLKGLGFGAVGNIKKYQENKAILTKAGLAMETIDELKKIKDTYNKYIISYNNMCSLCAKHNLYFGEASLFIGTMPMKNVKEIEEFPFTEFASHYSVLDIPVKQSIVEGNISTRSKAMIVAPLNLFKLENVFIAQSRELIHFPGTTSKCVYPCAEDPIVVLPFKTSASKEIFFVIITHWDSSTSII